MTLPLLILVASTLVGVVAVGLLTIDPDVDGRDVRLRTRGVVDRSTGPALALGAMAALLVVAVSGWIVPALIIGVATWVIVTSWHRRSNAGIDEVERTDALASWIENLRDVLLAGDQPVGAINATVPTAPVIIRPAVRRLAASLGHQDPERAFRRFADEIDDPLGDLVAAGLLIAVQRGARTVAVLTSLAEQARTQADRRRIVAAERAPLRREVMLLSLIMGTLVVGLLVFGRAEYLEPYDTADGQLFLGVVLTIYAALLVRVQRLARFPRPARFLTGSGAGAGRRGGDVGTGSPGRMDQVGAGA